MFIVRALHTAAVLTVTEIPLAIVTSSVEVGTPLGFQLFALFQFTPSPPPSQVFCPKLCCVNNKAISNKANEEMILFAEDRCLLISAGLGAKKRTGLSSVLVCLRLVNSSLTEKDGLQSFKSIFWIGVETFIFRKFKVRGAGINENDASPSFALFVSKTLLCVVSVQAFCPTVFLIKPAIKCKNRKKL